MSSLKNLCKEIKEEIEAGIPDNVTEFALDLAIKDMSYGDDQDDLKIVWSKDKPSLLAMPIEGTAIQPLGIWVNPFGRVLEPGERAEVEEALGKFNSLTTQTSFAWIVARLRSMEKLRAWCIKSKGSEGEEATKVLSSSGDLQLMELNTVGHLVLEGRQCGHCIGQRSAPYRKQLENKSVAFVSVRSKRNPRKALVTAEIKGSKINHIQGRRGSVVSAAARTLVQEYAQCR